MKRVALYSSARPPGGEAPEAKEERSFSWRQYAGRHRRVLKVAAGALAVVAVAMAAWMAGSGPRGLTEADVEAAVQRVLAANARPTAADAFERIAPSIVHVRAYGDEQEARAEEKDKPKEKPAGEEKPAGPEKKPETADKLQGNVGTGVVIVDTGVILTNLHVVRGAKRLKITFADGLESDAEVIGER